MPSKVRCRAHVVAVQSIQSFFAPGLCATNFHAVRSWVNSGRGLRSDFGCSRMIETNSGSSSTIDQSERSPISPGLFWYRPSSGPFSSSVAGRGFASRSTGTSWPWHVTTSSFGADGADVWSAATPESAFPPQPANATRARPIAARLIHTGALLNASTQGGRRSTPPRSPAVSSSSRPIQAVGRTRSIPGCGRTWRCTRLPPVPDPRPW